VRTHEYATCAFSSPAAPDREWEVVVVVVVVVVMVVVTLEINIVPTRFEKTARSSLRTEKMMFIDNKNQ
jgi:hypothetical protein